LPAHGTLGYFVDWDYNCCHLLKSSPCIDVGNKRAPSIPDVDIDGQGRVILGKRDITIGQPVPVPTVDMGADEYYGKRMKKAPNDPAFKPKHYQQLRVRRRICSLLPNQNKRRPVVRCSPAVLAADTSLSVTQRSGIIDGPHGFFVFGYLLEEFAYQRRS